MPFKSWKGYSDFRTAVMYGNRYMFDDQTASFLNEVLSSCKSRIQTIQSGTIFWRSQLGSHTNSVIDSEGKEVANESCPHLPERMYPLKYAASEGRANPKGIPCLYLATDKETAMSEVRPWIGSEISVAQFMTAKELTIIDCSINRSSNPLFFDVEHGFYEPSDEEKERAVWAHIDKAFSVPIVLNENQAHYAPTQIIAELFKRNGYDGVAYKSMLGEGYNIALFDLESAEILNCSLYEAKKVNFDFSECANPYFMK